MQRPGLHFPEAPGANDSVRRMSARARWGRNVRMRVLGSVAWRWELKLAFSSEWALRGGAAASASLAACLAPRVQPRQFSNNRCSVRLRLAPVGPTCRGLSLSSALRFAPGTPRQVREREGARMREGEGRVRGRLAGPAVGPCLSATLAASSGAVRAGPWVSCLAPPLPSRPALPRSNAPHCCI